MSLERIMSRDLKKVSATTHVLEAARIMGIQKIGSLLIERNGKVEGILTESDIVRRAVAKGLDISQLQVDKIMSSPIITLEKGRTPREAVDLMGDAGIRHIVVTDRGAVAGIISVRDLLIHFKIQSEPQMGID